VQAFLNDHLDMETSDICIQNAHRLGTFARDKIKPIIVSFRNLRDIELILSNAYKLKGKPDKGITRDYPNEIVQAQGRLWSTFKAEKAKNKMVSVKIANSAKLIVNRKVIKDEFPDWNEIMQDSRIPTTRAHSTTKNHYQPMRNENINATSNQLPVTRHNPYSTLMEHDSQNEVSSETDTAASDESVDDYSKSMLQYQALQEKQPTLIEGRSQPGVHDSIRT
jgi:hypothetical protein